MIRVSFLAVILSALNSSFLVANEDFAGTWVNIDKETRGLTRLEISEDDKVWVIQSWGAVEGGECDHGKATLHLLGDDVGDNEMKYGIASWTHGFKETHVTLRLEKGELVVHDYNVFTDNSGRSNYLALYTFKKAQ